MKVIIDGINMKSDMNEQPQDSKGKLSKKLFQFMFQCSKSQGSSKPKPKAKKADKKEARKES
jgi:hypothetical protein